MPITKVILSAERLTTSFEATLDQVKRSTKWRHSNADPNIGFSNHAEWLRFEVKNLEKTDLKLRFYWHHAQANDVQIHTLPQTQQYSLITLGSLIPVEDRPIESTMLEWEYLFDADSTTWVYIRVATPLALSFRVKVGLPKEIETLSRNTESWAYLYLGIMLSLALYNLSLARSTNDRSYLFYSLYVLIISLYVVTLLGFTFSWGFYQTPIGELRVTLLLSCGWAVAALFFVRSFLQIHNRSKNLNISFWVCLSLVSFLVILALIPRLDLYFIFAPTIIFGTVIYVLALGIYTYVKGLKYLRFFLIGWVCLTIGLTSHQISLFFGFDQDWIARESIKIATALEAIFLSWALGYRIQDLRSRNKILNIEKNAALKNVNDQLALRLKSQEELTREKDGILNIISHELKTPLNVIQSSIELANDQHFPNPEQLHDLSMSSERMRRHIDNIVMLSEITTDQAFSVEQITNLDNLLKHLALYASYNLLDQQIWKLDYQGAPHLLLYTDERKLTLLLENLIDNAVKFTKAGHITLSLLIKDGRCIWKISDTGLGMSREECNNVHHFFSQKDISKTRNIEGLGIGLSVVTQLSKLLDGEITIRSEENVGTDITFSHAFTPEKNLTKTSILPKSALIVDDNPVNLKLMCKLFERLGFSIGSANNGLNAIEQIKLHNYDVVFMDLQMPVMDGFTATREMRALGYKGKVIAVTANDTSADRKRALECGMDDFIGKPLRLADLRNRFKLPH